MPRNVGNQNILIDPPPVRKKTKRGIYGEEFFIINKKLVDLSQPLLTEDSKVIIEQYHTENLDHDGRGYKNLMRMMMSDGIFKYLPKHDNAWFEFLTPFMKLTRKEKRRLSRRYFRKGSRRNFHKWRCNKKSKTKPKRPFYRKC